jgi:hypothetical protein
VSGVADDVGSNRASLVAFLEFDLRAALGLDPLGREPKKS